MIAARQNSTPPRVNNRAANYFLALRQISGITLIVLSAVIAWLLVHLPLSYAYTAIAGYGSGLALLLPGALLATRGRTSGKAMLGSGAALVFLITVTILFGRSPFQLPLHPYGGMVLCAGMLTLFALLAWRATSQSVSLLTLCLALYALYLIAPELSMTAYSLMLFIGTGLLVLWLCLWTTYRTERLFIHLALFLGYGGLYAFGRQVDLSPAWIAAAALLLYTSMTALSVDQVFRDPARHRSLLFFSCANTLLYATAGLLLLGHQSTGFVWLIIGAVFVTSTLATLALYLVHGDGSLISMYAAAAVLALLTCLLLPLTPGFRLVVLAAGCLAPALLSLWRTDRLLRFTEYGLLITMFFASFSLNTHTGFVQLGFLSIPTQWAWLLSAAAVLCLACRFHSFWIMGQDKDATVGNPTYHPEQELPALACANTAALLITIHTILSRGDSEALPIILSAQGMVFLGLGMALLTPALSLAGLVPVIAAHTVYYAFPYMAASATWTPADTETGQVYTLIIVTIALALFIDRLLLTRLGMESTPREKILAAIPYLPALALLPLTTIEFIPVAYLPPLLGLASLILLLPIWLRRGIMPGMNAVGFGMAILSVVTFIYTSYSTGTPVYSLPWYLPLLGVYVIALVLMERLAASCNIASVLRKALTSYGLIIVAAGVGAMGLYSWNSGSLYFVALLGLSALLAVSGRIFRAKGYYHVALALALFALGFALLSGSPGVEAAATALAALRLGI